MKTILFSTVCIISLLSGPGRPEAATINTIALSSMEEDYFYGPVASAQIYGGNPGGFLSAHQQPSHGNIDGSFSIINFPVESLTSQPTIKVYLSLTEARTVLQPGTVNFYSRAPSLPVWQNAPQPLSSLQTGLTFLATASPSGIGGTQLLIDVTSAYHAATSSLSLVIESPDNGDAFLGKNYLSGYQDCATTAPGVVCQYFAASLYEYPTLMVTDGNGMTPLDQLASNPVLHDPLGYPSGWCSSTQPYCQPPSPPPVNGVPEPAGLVLFTTGILGAGLIHRRRSRVTPCPA